MFEHGKAGTVHNAAIESVQSERQKEIEMLLNRWDKNKQLASSRDCSVNVDSANNKTAALESQMNQVTLYKVFIINSGFY
jgi:hypothetical protein